MCEDEEITCTLFIKNMVKIPTNNVTNTYILVQHPKLITLLGRYFNTTRWFKTTRPISNILNNNKNVGLLA